MAAKIPAAGVDLDGAVTIIESSADVDFRVESDGNTHALFDDASTNLIGVGETGTLASQFHVTAPSGFSQYIVDFDNASTSSPYGLFQNYSGAAPDDKFVVVPASLTEKAD